MDDGSERGRMVYPQSSIFHPQICIALRRSSHLIIVAIFGATAGERFGGAVKQAVGAAVLDGFLGEEPFIAVEIAMDGFRGFAGVIGHELVEAGAPAAAASRFAA